MVLQGIGSGQIGMISTPVSGFLTKADQAAMNFEHALSKSMNSDDMNTNAQAKASNTKAGASEKKISETNGNTKEISADQNVKVSEKEEVIENVTSEVLDEELVEDIEELICAGFQIVTQMLQITPEELNQMLVDLDLKPEDLLTQDGLTKLFLHHNGLEDVSDLLVNQDATNELNALLTKVNSMVEDANLTVAKEDFSGILEQYYAQKDGVVNKEELQSDEIDVKKSKDQGIVNDVLDETTPKNEVDVKIEVNSTKQSHSENESHGNMEHDVKPDTENFIEHLAFSKPTEAVNLEPVLDKVTQYREIVSQIVEQIKINISEEQTTMHMNLNPESLGKVQVSITSKNGVMNAQFLVQNETAKEAIENQMNTLIKTFDEQGFKVQGVEVAVSDFAFQENFDQRMSGGNEKQSQDRQSGRRNITLDEAMSLEQLSDDEQIILDMMELNGNQVDYTA